VLLRPLLQVIAIVIVAIRELSVLMMIAIRPIVQEINEMIIAMIIGETHMAGVKEIDMMIMAVSLRELLMIVDHPVLIVSSDYYSV